MICPELILHCYTNCMYLFCSFSFGQITSTRAVCDVKGMVACLVGRVIASLRHEGVGGASNHCDVRYEQIVEVPRDPPASGA